ncbi:MAG: ABC transporter substrate-binding protein, partial [Xanthobacteraceae bacterium]
MRRREFITLIAGVAATLPSTASAQQPSATPVIGYLHFGSPGPFAYQVAAFDQGLNENGYVVGKN